MRLGQFKLKSPPTVETVNTALSTLRGPIKKIEVIECALASEAEFDEKYQQRLIKIAVRQAKLLHDTGHTEWYLYLLPLLRASHNDHIVTVLETVGGDISNVQVLLLDEEYAYRALANNDPSYIDKIDNGNMRITALVSLAYNAPEVQRNELIDHALELYLLEPRETTLAHLTIQSVNSFPFRDLITHPDSGLQMIERCRFMDELTRVMALIHAGRTVGGEQYRDELFALVNGTVYEARVRSLWAVATGDFASVADSSPDQHMEMLVQMACNTRSPDVLSQALAGLCRSFVDQRQLLRRKYQLYERVVAANNPMYAELLVADREMYIQALAEMAREHRNIGALQKLLYVLRETVAVNKRPWAVTLRAGEAITSVAPFIGSLASGTSGR